jgi:DNA polymerase-3 subunit beta
MVKAPVAEFAESLERASLMADAKSVSIAALSVGDSVMTIKSENDEGRVIEEVPIQKSGEDVSISFNARFLSDILKSISDERVILEFSGPQSPGLVKPVDSERFLYLIMPVRS